MRRSTPLKREALNKNEEILLFRDSSRQPETFRILDGEPVGEGGSCICYHAEYKNQRGLLKEFYPIAVNVKGQDASGQMETIGPLVMERKGWQLRPSAEYGEAAITAWQEAMDDYRLPYETTLQNLNRSEGADILNAYLVDAEVFRDAEEGGNLYLWTRHNAAGMAWDKVLKNIRRDAYTEYQKMRAQGLVTMASNRSIPNGEQVLKDILATVKAIALILHNLHNQGFVHLDVKPENFLVLYDRKNHLDPSRVVLVDVDTIYNYVESDPRQPITSNVSCKYAAPEMLEDGAVPTPRSDLYALVGCLYHAIMFPDDKGNYGGSYVNCCSFEGCQDDACAAKEDCGEEEFFHADRILRTDLIRSLAPRMQKMVSEALSKIFRDVLGDPYEPESRFLGCREDEVCGELIERLEGIEKILSGKVKTDSENDSEREKEANDSLQSHWLIDGTEGVDMDRILRDLFYQYPIYQTLPDNADTADVLILGSGKEACRFLDILLQVMQVRRCGLRVIMASTDEKIRSKWNERRPAAKDFLRIRGEGKPSEACYGELTFIYLEKEWVEEVLEEHPYCVAFVAAGTDRENLYWAKLAHENLREHGGIVHYICENPERAEDKELLHSICIKDETRARQLSTDLIEQAYNTHCIWANPELSEEELRRDFYDEAHDGYNFRASIAFATAIRYKMWDMGLDVSNPESAAAEWHKIVAAMNAGDADARDMILELAALEHRRWVMDKVTQGYSCLKAAHGETVADCCVDLGRNSGVLARKPGQKYRQPVHNCIVSSTAGAGMPEDDGTRDGYIEEGRHQSFYHLWNREPLESLEKILQGDALDLMNVRMHRNLKNYDMSRLCGVESPLESGLWRQLFQLVGDEPTCRKALNRMEDAVRRMMNCQDVYMGSLAESEKSWIEWQGREAVKDFRFSLRDLKEACREDGIREIRKAMLVQSLTLWERIMYPLLEGNSYRSYKASDKRMMRGLAATMTFRRHQQVAVKLPLSVVQDPENGERLLQEHLHRLMQDVKPSGIIFYMRFTEWMDDMNAVPRALLKAVDFVKAEKNIPCQLKILLTKMEETLNIELRYRLELECRSMEVVEQLQVMSITGGNTASMAESCARALKGTDAWHVDIFDDTDMMFREEEQEETFLEELQLPFLRYDAADPAKGLTLTMGCEYLNYVKDWE